MNAFFPRSRFAVCWGIRGVLIRHSSSVGLMVFKQHSPNGNSNGQSRNWDCGRWCGLSDQVSYLWNRNLTEVSMLCTLPAPNLTFPSANVPYGGGLPLRTFRTSLEEAFSLQSLSFSRNPTVSSLVFIPALLSFKSRKHSFWKFTGPEVHAENLLNSLGPGISLFSLFCWRQSGAGWLALGQPGAVKKRETNNRAAEIPAWSLFVDGAHTVSFVYLWDFT